MKSPPYRTHPRTADLAMLRAMSTADGRLNDPYLPYGQELALITEWKRKKNEQLPRSLLLRWVLHPDERVRIEFFRSRVEAEWLDSNGKSINVGIDDWEKLFVERYFAELREEGIYWTPLLDVIFSHPTRSNHWSRYREALDGLTNWIKTQATQDHVRELLKRPSSLFNMRGVLICRSHANCISTP